MPHWILLAVATAVVGLSMLLSLGSEPGQVMLPLINCPLPPLCTMKRLTGLDCPGCGLTRSFIALGHGQWRDSFRFNPAGPIWFALIGVALVVCLAYFDVEISARVLGVALISEILIIAISSIFFFVHAHDVAIVGDGAPALPATVSLARPRGGGTRIEAHIEGHGVPLELDYQGAQPPRPGDRIGVRPLKARLFPA